MPAIAGHWLTAKCARDDALVRATARSRICDARLQVITRWPNAPRRTSADPTIPISAARHVSDVDFRRSAYGSGKPARRGARLVFQRVASLAHKVRDIDFSQRISASTTKSRPVPSATGPCECATRAKDT